MTHAEIEELTFAHIPEAFFGRLLRAVFMAHQVASEDCQKAFAQTEAKNVAGLYRRGKLEGYMRDAADMAPGIDHQVVPGEGGWNHTELRSGPVVLTASSVQSPCEMVEEADFRESLAHENPPRLWDEPDDLPPVDIPLYALLLHSKSRWVSPDEQREFGHLPGSAYLAYPSPGLKFYVHEINLFERFPEIVAGLTPQAWNQDVLLRYIGNARRGATG